MALSPERIRLWGDTLCLDVANSVSWSPADEHLDPEQTDVLRTPDMLGRWGRRLGLVGATADPPSEAELDRVRAVRDATYRVFASISRDGEPPADGMTLLLGAYADAAAAASFAHADGRYRLDWPAAEPARLRYAVVTDAVALLQDPQRLRRISRCPGRDCGWLFLNLSGRRRWCSMTTCGSREKVRRHYHRSRNGKWERPDAAGGRPSRS